MTDVTATTHLLEVDYDPFASPELARAVPTTEAQREIWLAVQLGHEASMSYNESVTLRLEGRVDVAAMQNALLALSDRHEALRTTFGEDGQNMLVAAHGQLQAELIDLGALDAAGQEAQRAALRAAAVETPFDLLEGPLLRAQIVTLSPDLHELILTGHHIVCDGWSFGVLSRDLMALYECFVSGQDPQALPMADSFADHALAQLDAQHVATAEADLQYWLGRFRETPPVLDLPADRPRPAVRRFESRREDLALDGDLVRAVKAAGARCGASLFVTLFATFASLVTRLSRGSDVVVGVSAAGQSVEGKPSLVGHCVNMLPVRLDIDVEAPMSAVLEQTRSAVLDAYEHQSCTFGSLLAHLKLPRDASRPSLVPVVFNLDTAITSSELSRAGLTVSLLSNPRHYENFEAFLNASETQDGVLLELQYSTALFDRATVQRWLALYRRALQRLAAQPGAVAAEILAPDETDIALVDGFNHTDRPYEAGLRLGDLVLRGLRAEPQATALVFEGRSVSAAELEGLAWAVAARLREQGAGPGTLVGVCLERSVEMVAALLGTVLSGAAYVPLDPTLPADRLRQMGDDAGLKLLLTREAEAARAGAGFPTGCRTLLLDGLQPQPASALVGEPGDPAYVIFTSGSTGRPKGAMNSHAGIVNRLLWMQQEYRLQPGDRVMQKTPFTFDVSVWEFFWPVLAGATLVVARPEGHRDGGYLVELIRRERVTLMHFVPSMLRLFLAEPSAVQCRSLRQVVCSGEALPADLVERFFAMLPGVKLDNLYGPTEAAVDVTVWACSPTDRSGTVPIGRPIANTTMYVLDEKLRPLPVGVPGDLYIGGVQVGMGYVARPELSAERFLSDPFRPGGRMYKTGDVASWRSDGALIYLGRSDFQVKLRGYRIELGEIEAQLQQHHSVAASTVVTWSDPSGDMRLVAYVVPAPAAAVDAAALRDFLRQTLPDYMIPQHVVALPAMPLLSSGKVDRRALPAPVFEAASPGQRVAPATATESAVLSAMEDILKLPGLGVLEDFFALGGHSLLAARLITRLNREFELQLPMRVVFETPTVRGLAGAVDKARSAPSSANTRRIARQADQARGPLTLMQERIRFVEELHPGRVVYNTPSAHRLKGPLDRAAFSAALAAMVRRQPSLRTCVEATAQGPLQHVVDLDAVELPFEDLSALPAHERESVLMQRLQQRIDQPIDIHVAPLFRAALYRLGEEEHVFLFMPHHIVWDGWSFDLLYQEMSALYPAAVQGVTASLPLPPVSYVDYAHWHAQWMKGDECRAQIDFWKRRYRDIQTPRPLATDRPRRAGMSGAGAVEWIHVDKTLTEKLREVAVGCGATLNMLVMAVYAAMMSRALASRSLVIGVPVRGRLSADVESVMGFFNNLLPVHLDLDTAATLPDWLSQVKRDLLDAFANQDVPFERLATEPEIARHASNAGLYQTLFSFQDARERERRWGSLSHSSVLVMQKGATEDLGLWLMEVPGGLEGGFNYNADLFDAATARVFRERLLGLLRRVAEQPGRDIEALLADSGADLAAFDAWVATRSAAAAAAAAAPRLAPTPAPAAPAAPAAAAPAQRGTRSAALSGGVTLLAALWAELLGVPAAQILAEDNFFDLGGNSLLVMQVVALAKARLGLDLDPRRFVYEPLGALVPPGGAEVASPAPSLALAEVWAGLLGIDAAQIRPEDNFFDLGGNSLLVMRAVADAQRQLGLAIEPRRYVYESLAQLSAGATAVAAVPAAPAGPGPAADAAPGLLARVFGRLGRRS